MSYRVITPQPGTRWVACDAFGDVGPADADDMVREGIRAVGLYTAVVTARTLENVTSRGMGVFFILEGLSAPTSPSAELGQRQAEGGIARLAALGIPAGATVSGDLEGHGHTPAQWIGYSDAQSHTIAAARHIPAGYIGFGVGLTSRELFALAMVRYWKSASRVEDRNGQLAEPACGWCMFQGLPTDVRLGSGLTIDLDALWQDYHGRSFSLVIADGPSQMI